ncbi:4-alpha-glucanotransferase [Mesorhizobium sp. CAU 1741]|uniref:4-alpha-glucanotransferase n=1 Tax=Mesorhizobium sp. CAU 1741 TaxID=3140366 RepID=UPI00325BCA60
MQDAPTTLAQPCFFPDWLRERRSWGMAVQLYELRSRRDWGIGDFADLAAFCEIAAQAGAQFIGLNPLSALFAAEPERCSPFSPSSRQFLNPLYIAVDEVDGFESGMVDDEEVARLRARDLVDYAGVTRLKLSVLRQIWIARKGRLSDTLESFIADQPLVQRHATFEALSSHMRDAGHGAGWSNWPEPFRDAGSPDVGAFAKDNADDVAFHVWLQMLSREQLAAAATRARQAGMRIGLYLDFPVGEAPDGSATWSNPELSVANVSIGAPPDVFTTQGQDWGLAPLSPLHVADDDFGNYKALMDDAMRCSGALRIDHAMALRQLFWIPRQGSAAEGGYVMYPMTGMLKALADLSRQNEVIVIGEDLGHVPEGFRDVMSGAGILSYRILYFERAMQRFLPSRNWPSLALACLSTHDLPTLKGWWAGNDIALRLEYGLIDADAARHQERERRGERASLLRRLQFEGLLRRQECRALARKRRLDERDFTSLSVAAHRFIARTPGRLACVRLADAVGEEHPTNLPGTSDEYPNWRRKLPVLLEDLPSLPLFRALTTAIARERPL